MSDNTNPTIEQAVETLRDRGRELDAEWEIVRGRLMGIEARQDELRQAIDTLTHVRPKRGRPRGSSNSAAIEEVRGILRTDTPFDADGVAP